MEMVSTVSVSVHDLLDDSNFKNALQMYGWATQPEKTSDGLWFYNASSNAALCLTQKPSYVEIGVQNALQAHNEALAPTRQISTKRDALQLSIMYMRDFAEFNVFENTNQFGA